MTEGLYLPRAGDHTAAPRDLRKNSGGPHKRCREPQRTTRQRPGTAQPLPGTTQTLPVSVGINTAAILKSRAPDEVFRVPVRRGNPCGRPRLLLEVRFMVHRFCYPETVPKKAALSPGFDGIRPASVLSSPRRTAKSPSRDHALSYKARRTGRTAQQITPHTRFPAANTKNPVAYSALMMKL